jgi:hypothetical protein
MSQLRHEEEEHEFPDLRVNYTGDEILVEDSAEEQHFVPVGRQRAAALDEMRCGLPLGIAQGTLAGWVMTELARIGNPPLLINGTSGWLLYAVLGAISGLAAATGRRNTAWSSAGMAAAVLISPPLLEWICRITDRPLFVNPAETSLVLVAALILGAFTWLNRWSSWRAAWTGAVGYWLLDYLYNTITVPAGLGQSGALWDAAWVSAEHGFLVGAALALLRSASQALLDWRTRWINQATDRMLAWMRSTKDA